MYLPSNNSRLSEFKISIVIRRTYKVHNGEHPIVLRIYYRGAKRDMNTGLTVAAENWLPRSGCVMPKAKHAAIINQQIQEIVQKTHQIYQKIQSHFGDVTLDELVKHIKGGESTPESIVEYLNGQLKDFESRIDIDLSKRTYYKYKRTAKYLKEFLEQKMSIKNIPVSRIDHTFLEAFFKFLRKERKNGHNTAVALMNCLKTILHEPVKKGVIRYNPFVNMPLKRVAVKRDYLTIEEIKTLQELEGLTPSTERNRDIFIFACFTGLAYSDLATLKAMHIIVEPDGSKHIEKYREKTGILSYVPLLPVAEKILLKYSPTDDCRDFIWRVPSNQKLNFDLKIIAKKAGMEKTLFMHLARHTFATTVTLSNGVPLESVAKMIGHSGMKNVMIYAKIVNSKVKNDMKGLMDMF